MTQKTPSILVLGAGVSGMAAALRLSDQGTAVHLVEKSDALGGHAAQWACMATDTCENCGACLSIDMADQVRQRDNITTHLGTTLKTVDKSDNGYQISLDGSDSFTATKIIMATGFSPFDTTLAPSFHHDIYENVITTAQLNTVLKNETMDKLLNGKKDPKIAFVQCVGSRNRSLGRDYCSQVCCKISMRHAKKLAYLYPDAGITLFYMDLQVIGKEIRPLFHSLEKQVSLVQGVPAEILEDSDSGMLSIVTEDPETASRTPGRFDLIILSVGMQPGQEAQSTQEALGLTPNSWGFFNTDQVQLSDDVIVAGCAKGPKDILSAIQDGKIAASKALQAETQKQSVAVIGTGSCADTVSESLSQNGHDIFLFGAGNGLSKDSKVSVLNDSEILSVGGTVGNFSIFYQSGSKKQTLRIDAIIAADEADFKQPAPVSVKNIISFEDFTRAVEKNEKKLPDSCAVLLDYNGPENKAVARQALEYAAKAKDNGKDMAVICNKMLVHGPQGQQLYDNARKSGVAFYRFDKPEDIQLKDDAQGVAITLKEATLPSIELNLSAGALVLPPTVTAADRLKQTAQILGQQLDKEGFLQSANVRHRMVQSPCRGIFFAGNGHDEVDEADITAEIDEISAALDALDSGSAVREPGVEINEKKCAQCLTCIRICPHGAIVMNDKNRPQIVPDACFSCHLCVSNCPAYAIESTDFSNDQMAGTAQKDKTILLACSRSAALAAKPVKLPENLTLVQVPCACRISSDILLRMMVNGASKVMVLGCHEENCQSLKGSSAADTGVKQVLNIPGIDSSMIMWEPVAANETKKFERIISKA